MNLSTNQKETHRHRDKTYGCQGVWEREMDRLGIWGWQMQTITFRIYKQPGLTVQHRELYSVSSDKSKW